MKALVFLVLIVFLALFAGAQTTTPADTLLPEAVVKGLKAKYPKASADEWLKEGENYVVTFFIDNKWYDATFTMKGKWMTTSIQIDYENLPETVRKAFESSIYGKMEILKISEEDLSLKKETIITYKFYLLDREENEKQVKFNASGTLIP